MRNRELGGQCRGGKKDVPKLLFYCCWNSNVSELQLSLLLPACVDTVVAQGHVWGHCLPLKAFATYSVGYWAKADVKWMIHGIAAGAKWRDGVPHGGGAGPGASSSSESESAISIAAAQGDGARASTYVSRPMQTDRPLLRASTHSLPLPLPLPPLLVPAHHQPLQFSSTCSSAPPRPPPHHHHCSPPPPHPHLQPHPSVLPPLSRASSPCPSDQPVQTRRSPCFC